MNPNTKQFWDKKYGKYIAENRIRSDGKHLLKFMHLFENAGSVLDFGSGLGGNVQFLASQLNHKRFILVDHSEHSLEYARERLLGAEDDSGNAFEYYPDLSTIPEQSVDLVISIQVLEHITEYREILDRLWRVVKPGGGMLISVPVLGIRDRTRVHVNKFTLRKMFQMLVPYNEVVHISPRTYSKRSGRLSTAYFHVEKPAK